MGMKGEDRCQMNSKSLNNIQLFASLSSYRNRSLSSVPGKQDEKHLPAGDNQFSAKSYRPRLYKA